MRVLRVKGVGTAYETPNLIVIQFTVRGEDYVYDEAMRKLNQNTALLRSDVIKAGFLGDDLKTTQFRVDTRYSYHNNQQVFNGYVAIHELRLEFDYDKERLNQLLTILSRSQSNAEFKVNFEVKEKEAFKQQLLTNAVKDAISNANVIANAASIKLGRIMNITYDFQDIIFRSNIAYESKAIALAPELDINPMDIKATDSVTVEWEIEDYI